MIEAHGDDPCMARAAAPGSAAEGGKVGSVNLTFYATIDSDSIRPFMPRVPIMLPASSSAASAG